MIFQKFSMLSLKKMSEISTNTVESFYEFEQQAS